MENRNRRRESFVNMKRKSLTFTNIFNEENDESQTSPRLSMTDYLESLKREKQEWKDYFQQKKRLYENGEKFFKLESSVIRREDIENKIPEDYKLFLENKPDYYAMVTSVQDYANSLLYMNNFKSDLIDCYDKACNDIGVNTKLIIDKMIANDLCDVCNKRDCNTPSHKFSI